MLALAFCAFCFCFTVTAQSNDQNFPTAITTNEIDGVIKVRDIGDSRLTSYFYSFDGVQGDIFINVVTKNFTGDIDVFSVDGLRPLTKMVIYSDGGVSETGRLVYLRKPERLLLRVEGRSPNDDPATFKIKFAGSFVALSGQKSQDAPTIKGAEVNAESGVRVNSVGTIIEVIPKPQPSAKPTPDAKEAIAAVEKRKPEPVKKPSPPATVKKESKENVAVAKVVEKKPAPPKAPPAEIDKKNPPPASKPAKKASGSEVKTVFGKNTKPKATPKAEKPPAPTPSDPMASIRLVVQLKDGKVIERPMSEITTFRVDNGVLTVIAKDGKTVRYSMLEVAKVTIE
ncbi:MAG: hypothetical protein IPL32_15785 [Chloracidobacterium sp.]|nr:hypothetical protein [Chloracidobacterium sp.]